MSIIVGMKDYQLVFQYSIWLQPQSKNFVGMCY